jgi:PIN domain nuclease of toxin-antitoxin system
MSRLQGDARLRPRVREILERNEGETYVSAISAYEMSQKYRLGKWPEVEPYLEGLERWAAATNISILNVTPRHAIRAGLLAGAHRDPFDRMLVAQAMVEGLSLVSKDGWLRGMGAEVVWG